MRACVKYNVIYRHQGKYSISEMCRFFGVSRSGYYSYIIRMDKPAKDLPLAEKIRECQACNRNTYGYRRVHMWLERNGIFCNPKTVLRVMNKYNLLSVVRRKRYVRYGEALHRYPNLLNRNFTAERPNQKWVTDISYIRTAQGFCICPSSATSMITALSLTKQAQSRTSILSSIQLGCAKKEKVTAELQLHSDQGFQYTSTAYFKLTKKYDITPSMSRRGNPYDNASAENFFSILKTECVNRVKIQSYEEARKLIDDYIFFYNHQRIQTKTKLTPLELRCQFST